MMKKSKRIWLLACVLGAMGNGIVSAEEAAPVYMLDTVNVTAQAYEKKNWILLQMLPLLPGRNYRLPVGKI